MGTQEGEEDWVDVANDLLRKCGVNFRLTKLADCVGNVFLAFYENILGVKVPGVIADPKTPEDDIHNVQSVIDSLALDYLQISLSHITGENLVRGDKESIKNLLEIFDGLLEYLNEEISEELHNGGLNEGLTEVFLPAVGRDGLRSTEQVVADMLERTSLSSSECCWTAEETGSIIEPIKLGHSVCTFTAKPDAPPPLEPLPSALPIRPPYQATTTPLHHTSPAAWPPPAEESSSQLVQEHQAGSDPPEPASEAVVVTNGRPSSSQVSSPALSAMSENSHHQISQVKQLEIQEPDVVFLPLPKEIDPPANSHLDSEEEAGEGRSSSLGPGRMAAGPVFLEEDNDNDELSTHRRKNKAAEKELHCMSEKLSRRLQDLDQMLQRVLGESGDLMTEEGKHHQGGCRQTGVSAQTHTQVTPCPQATQALPPRSPPPTQAPPRPEGPTRGARGPGRRLQTNLKSAPPSRRIPGREGGRGASQVYEEQLRRCEAREEERLAQERFRAQEAERAYREAILRDLPQRACSSPGQCKREAQLRPLPSRPGAARQQQDHPRRAPQMKVKQNDLLRVLLKELPLLQHSPHGLARMWEQQMGQVEQLHHLPARIAHSQSRKQGSQVGPHHHLQCCWPVEEAKRRRDLLVEIIRKEREHNKRLRDFKERIQQQKAAQNRLREQRQQVARARNYHSSFHVQLRAHLTRARSKEEKMLREVFSEGLALQKASLKEERSYAREHRLEQSRRHLEHISSMENYYRDQFSLLAETLSEERQEIQVCKKAQEKALMKMKRKLRSRMEWEVGELQSVIVHNDQDHFFQDLEVQRLRRRVQTASFQYERSGL
ncbi:centrosomal protein of 95 kDa isoform X4 [Gadus morhua]|uniref:centrosomal protein of 95 kDa isoform X4 n=1 Tax=Gadus morhua TaxID=8049 RepID=UPI0011B67A53|nr:centrosomal protein of 95 kDa isoform X4 [Gadus morhua]